MVHWTTLLEMTLPPSQSFGETLWRVIDDLRWEKVNSLPLSTQLELSSRARQTIGVSEARGSVCQVKSIFIAEKETFHRVKLVNYFLNHFSYQLL